MEYKFVPMNEHYAEEIIHNWRYEGELSIYNYENEKDWILSREAWGNGLFAVLNGDGELVGELSVQFLDPSEVALEEEGAGRKILWLGFGMKPELTGKGQGASFVRACAQYAVAHYNYLGKYLGLGVYTFNQRAIKAYLKAGFTVYSVNRYIKDGKNVESFWMRRPTANPAESVQLTARPGNNYQPDQETGKRG